jgi:hypothetical protein
MSHAPTLSADLKLDQSTVFDMLDQRLGRPAQALTEILALLEANLNDNLTALHFAAADLIKEYYWFGEVVKEFPALVIGGSFDTREENMGHTDDDVIQITVAYPPRLDRLALEKCWDTATVVKGVLYDPVLRSNYYDQQGRKLWTMLVPSGFRVHAPGGESWNNYYGVIAQFRLLQMPGMDNNLWVDRTPDP